MQWTFVHLWTRYADFERTISIGSQALEFLEAIPKLPEFIVTIQE
jgi:hypothetical protein